MGQAAERDLDEDIVRVFKLEDGKYLLVTKDQIFLVQDPQY
ncbi:MAG: hypothetical protein WA118_08405 [Carboxydocellales bacterium]